MHQSRTRGRLAFSIADGFCCFNTEMRWILCNTELLLRSNIYKVFLPRIDAV